MVVAAAQGRATVPGLRGVEVADVVLANLGRDDGAADVVALGDHAADALLVALHAEALGEEGGVAAGLGHAELHGLAVRGPARRLLLDGSDLALGGLGLLARGALLGGLGLLLLQVLVHRDAAPEPGVAGGVLQDPHDREVTRHQRVLLAVAQALARLVAGRRAVVAAEAVGAGARVAGRGLSVNRSPAAAVEASVVG